MADLGIARQTTAFYRSSTGARRQTARWITHTHTLQDVSITLKQLVPVEILNALLLRFSLQQVQLRKTSGERYAVLLSVLFTHAARVKRL